MYAPLRLPSVILIMSPREFFSVRAYSTFIHRLPKINRRTQKRREKKECVAIVDTTMH